jgi:hypothetical protein
LKPRSLKRRKWLNAQLSGSPTSVRRYIVRPAVKGLKDYRCMAANPLTIEHIRIKLIDCSEAYRSWPAPEKVVHFEG